MHIHFRLKTANTKFAMKTVKGFNSPTQKTKHDWMNRDNIANSKNMKHRSTKTKMLRILQHIVNHPFALPFVKQQKTRFNLTTKTLDDVVEQVNNSKYEYTQQVVDDTIKILSSMSSPKNTSSNISTKYIATMSKELKEKFLNKYEQELISPDNLYENSSKSENSEVICVKIPNSTYTITVNNIANNTSEQKWQEEKNPRIRFHKLFPSRDHNFKGENSEHLYIAGYQFHKMTSNPPYRNVPLRRIPDVENAIDTITYIENETLMKTYENQRKTFQYQGKVNKQGLVNEMLLFHGTSWSCVHQIATNNFDIEAIPKQLTTNNQTRKKSMLFGKGVYFSEIPALSLIYGDGLILCKVLPGLCENIKMQNKTGTPINAPYDSRVITTPAGTSIIHVIKRTSQILPYCVISLKQKSLIQEFSKPVNSLNSKKHQSVQTTTS